MEWVVLGCGLVFGYEGLACAFIVLFAPRFVAVLLAASLVALLAELMFAVAMVRRRYSVLELDSTGIHLLGTGGFVVRFIPYASIRSVQTYLDEAVGRGTWRGVILGVHGGKSVTLELGENTGKVVGATCDHAHLVAQHSHCTWFGRTGC